MRRTYCTYCTYWWVAALLLVALGVAHCAPAQTTPPALAESPGAAAAANAERVVPAPTWEYQFPPGSVGSTVRLSGDFRYLATNTEVRSYHLPGEPDAVRTEGENAVYFFDLAERRLLWKEVFPEGSPAFVCGVSASGELVGVEIGGDTPEPGMRLYDGGGRFLVGNAPVEADWVTEGRAELIMRPPEAGEAPLSEELTAALAAVGIRFSAAFRGRRGFQYLYRGGPGLVAYLDPDGTTCWEYELPPSTSWGAGLIGSWGTLSQSPDREYALVGIAPTDVPEPYETRRILLFGRSQGLLWTKDLDMRLGGKTARRAYSVPLELSSGAASVVVERGPSPAVVQVFDEQGREKSSVAFGAVTPGPPSVSPNGRYWAAPLTRFVQGPGADDKGWTEGIHVFDCDTGEVVWRSPTMATASPVIVTDAGGVIAISHRDRALSVFDPPI